MENTQPTEQNRLTVESYINAPMDVVWKLWTEPEHIREWNTASDDWHTTKVINDLRPEGRFSYRMEAKDASQGFEFQGSYERVDENTLLSYTLDDGRRVEVKFETIGDDRVRITEVFDPAKDTTEETQQQGWQSILDNFTRYSESYNK